MIRKMRDLKRLRQAKCTISESRFYLLPLSKILLITISRQSLLIIGQRQEGVNKTKLCSHRGQVQSVRLPVKTFHVKF